ncbi:mechanosensitive ion channel domain-containing protein [Allomuricauda sp. d1]|uniref:mechanosensitive ion channel family protein n=1 Tax=Allomuricauda sp. d1 TaxID=3136725 RepID=UPI0031D26474
MENYKEILEESLGEIFRSAVQLLPKIVLGILGLIFAWLLVKILLFVLKRILRAAKVDRLSEKIVAAKPFGEKEVKIDLAKIILAFTRVLLILLFTVVLSEVLGLNAISDGIVSIFSYLPTLFSAILIFAGGLYLANLIKKAILSLFDSMGIGGSKFISGTIFYIIVFFISITALNQAGIDTEIITSNFTLILGAFLFAAALGFGLGSREVFSDIFKMFYARKTYMVGDKLSFGDVEGTIESIDNISMTLKTKEGKLVVPIKDVVSSKVSVKTQQ